MSQTLEAAVASVHGDLTSTGTTPVAALAAAGVKKVYGFEPESGAAETPCSITVHGAGWTPTEWLVEVRVYVSIEKTAQEMQTLAIQVCELVDNLLVEGPSVVTLGFEEALNAYVGLLSLQVGREDF